LPRVARRREIEAAPAAVWSLISDPYNLPRWWPRTVRVENVDRKDAGRRSQWTKVLETADRRGVRADYRCVSSHEGERFVWEQELEGTPFARILRRSIIEIDVQPEDSGTKVTLTSRQTLRGLSRLGSPMMRRATGRTLNDALDGIERALVGASREDDS
jgi:uncharacterized protein YndB with AHSA1/START domain